MFLWLDKYSLGTTQEIIANQDSLTEQALKNYITSNGLNNS